MSREESNLARQPLWIPSAERRARAELTRFLIWLERERGLTFDCYEQLWAWSVEDLEAFWSAVWAFFDVRQSSPQTRVLSRAQMPGAEWFPGSRLNYVEQILRHARSDAPAIIFDSEGRGAGELSWEELERRAAALGVALRAMNVQPGDRVVAYLPNIPEAVIAFLAVASVGAVWSLCAPDLGAAGVLDRFQQIAPKALIAADGYRFSGKVFDRRGTIHSIVEALPSLEAIVWIPILDLDSRIPASMCGRRVVPWHVATAGRHELAPLQVPFEHPLWIVYSSGTTGLPKAIVHAHGGALAIGLVMTALHWDLRAADRFFWYCSTGWIMWNLQVMGLLVGCTICLFDGSVTGVTEQADWCRLWRFAAERRVTFFGAGAAYFASCVKAAIRPAAVCDLGALQSVGSTGSPLSPDCYRWVYEAVKKDVWLLSVSGGTDIAGAFINGTPTLPVYAGEMQCRNLGAAVYAFDDGGTPVYDSVGELVCTKPMPSMPLYFWNDMENRRYLESYFDAFRDPDGARVWCHGDWLKLIVRPEATGAVIYGRSDSTINRHGIRIGTAELYRIVEAHPDVTDSIAVDLEYLEKPSYLGLFVVLRPGCTLAEELVREIEERIRVGLSPRCVPDEVRQIDVVPRTHTGKKLEIPIKKLMLGMPADKVVNRATVANPESIDWFVNYAAQGGSRMFVS